MFASHQKEIAAFAKQSPANTARVIEFVLVSIRRRFDLVKPMMKGECEVNTLDITKRGIQYARDNAIDLHAALFGEGMSNRDKMLALLAVPGLGIPKAGFVMQLCCGVVGCMDTHNLRRFNLDAKDFKSQGSVAAITKRIDAYMRVCEKAGGCEYLWDSWCELIAEKYPALFTDAEHVSRDHVDGIVF